MATDILRNRQRNPEQRTRLGRLSQTRAKAPISANVMTTRVGSKPTEEAGDSAEVHYFKSLFKISFIGYIFIPSKWLKDPYCDDLEYCSDPQKPGMEGEIAEGFVGVPFDVESIETQAADTSVCQLVQNHLAHYSSGARCPTSTKHILAIWGAIHPEYRDVLGSHAAWWGGKCVV